MDRIFIRIYKFLSRRIKLFFALMVLFVAVAAYLLSDLSFKEDSSSIIPRDERINAISDVFNSSEFADRIIVTFSFADTTKVDEALLVEAGRLFYDHVNADSTLIEGIDFEIDQTQILSVYDFVYNNLPLYMADADYARLDSLLNDSSVFRSVEAGYRTLLSPTGIATGKFFFKDPLHIAATALKKLSSFNIDENFEVYNGHIFTKDRKKLMLFIDPYHPASNTRDNGVLVQRVNQATAAVTDKIDGVTVESYGGTIVAVENSVQVKKDIILTVVISLVFLTLLFWLYFRQVRIILYLYVPVAVGTVVSLIILSLILGQISVIALGVGAILLCISIDYSLHVFTHVKESSSITETLQKVSAPVIISSLTTASALLCIYVLKSEALEQLSLFATFGILFTALSALIILPLLSRKLKECSDNNTSRWFALLVKPDFHRNKYLVGAVLVLSVVFAFSINRLKFNSDISTLNYQSDKVTHAEKNLKRISSQANSNVFVFSHGKSLDEALEKAEVNTAFVGQLQREGLVNTAVSVTGLLPGMATQQARIDKWNSYWDQEKKERLRASILSSGKAFKIKDYAFDKFFGLLDRDFTAQSPDSFQLIIDSFLKNFIIQAGGEFYVATVLKSQAGTKPQLLNRLTSNTEVVVFDQQLFINKLLDILNEDFSRLSLLSMVVVFVILLLYFGRIELATVTFVPILIGWLWTLGMMGLLGIEFNIFNVIISSFIFGLGLDYSVFVVSGLIDDYKHGNVPLERFKLSVLMAALTTVGGFGVLIFAKHPAIKSIASVSVIGIVSVLAVTFVITPLLFNLLVKSGNRKRIRPVVFSNLLLSVGTFMLFLGGALVMTMLVPFLAIAPIKRRQKKHAISSIICFFSKIIVALIFPIRKRMIDLQKLDFSKPSVIISNHQSHLDLVLLLMLHPKIIVFTNKWVYNNIFYGVIIRFADYYPAYKGLEEGFDKIRDKVANGYSILIFPEGKRSVDGSIGRFHQGVFSVAHQLGLDIQPLMIHGAYDCLPKTDFFLKSGQITLKCLDRIKPMPEETAQGITFRQQTKEVTALYRNQYTLLRAELETPGYFSKLLVHQYLYKGPVLEWYMRVKLNLEKDYRFFNDIIPKNAAIVDVGCGYGFLSYMLWLVSRERRVTGIDYDEEKIAVAANLPVNADGVQFVAMDIVNEPLPQGQVFIFNDVLHYLPEARQAEIVAQCMDSLPHNGMMIIRDADADLKRRTFITKLTEFQSTKIFRFNKAEHKLSFVSGRMIKDMAVRKGLDCQVHDQSYLGTSNITYVIKKIS